MFFAFQVKTTFATVQHDSLCWFTSRRSQMSSLNIMKSTAPRFNKWIMMRVSTSDFPLAWESWERKRRGGSCERLTDVSTNCSRVLLFVVVAAVRTGRRALLSHTCSSPGRCSLRGRTTAHNFSCYLNNWLKEAQWLSLRHKHTHCLCCVITNNTESNPPSTQRRCVCVCVHLSPDYQYNYAATFCPLQLLSVVFFDYFLIKCWWSLRRRPQASCFYPQPEDIPSFIVTEEERKRKILAS